MNVIGIKRLFDFTLAIFAVCILCIPIIMIGILVKLTSEGAVLFWSERVGVDNVIFSMPKFRSMDMGAPVVATDLLQSSDRHITSVGRFLRQSSLDELPQLWSILKGDMSFVGPRPALYNQDELIALRSQQGVHRLLPGLTGWAQVNGRDELLTPQKVILDVAYLNQRSFLFDLKVLWLTVFKVLGRSDVSH